mgnify:CR=1 FL=1
MDCGKYRDDCYQPDPGRGCGGHYCIYDQEQETGKVVLRLRLQGLRDAWRLPQTEIKLCKARTGAENKGRATFKGEGLCFFVYHRKFWERIFYIKNT